MKRVILVFCLVCLSMAKGFSQIDTIYIEGNNKPSNKDHAIYCTIVKKVSTKKFVVSRFQKYDDQWSPGIVQKIKIENDSTLIMRSFYKGSMHSKTIRKLTQEGERIYYFRDLSPKGILKSEGHTSRKFPLHLEGEIKEYYENGEVESLSLYKDNRLESNVIWNEDGSKYMDNVFDQVDRSPEFPGGFQALLQYIAKNVVYPESAQKNGVQGRVFVNFVVMEDGSVDGVKVSGKVDPLLSQAAKDVIRSTDKMWKPGILDGRKVRVAFTAPINFKLR